jgi:hypothetical protein
MGAPKFGRNTNPTGPDNAENLSKNEIPETEFLAQVCAVRRDYSGVCLWFGWHRPFMMS